MPDVRNASPRAGHPTAPAGDAALVWTRDALGALVAYASRDFDESQPCDIFEPLVTMLVGPVFGYRGAAVYQDQSEGWHRVAAAGQIAQPRLPEPGQAGDFTLVDRDVRLTLDGGGGGWVLLIRRNAPGIERHERDILHRLVALVDTVLDQHTYISLLARSERHYRHLYSHANLGIFFSRVGAGIQRANPGMLGILGYATERELREALTPQAAHRFFDPPCDRDRLVELLLSQGQFRDFQTRMRRVDGSLVPVSLTACVVQDPDGCGDDVEFFGFVTDLSSTESTEEVRHDLRRAEAANLDKVRFLASVSHELRTPLNGVVGMVEVLAGAGLDPEAEVAVGVIRQSAQQLLAQVDRMQRYTCLEMGTLTLAHEPFSAAELVTDAEARWREAAATKGIELAALVESDVRGEVQGDVARCREILDLLLENAMKFTERGGRVEIRVAAEGEALRLSVGDTGCGMSAERLASLLDHGVCPDADSLGGSGLGLAMVRRLVEFMDGRLWADSTPGRGSRFSVLLPLPRVAADVDAAARGASAEAVMRVLVVEDNPVNQLVARKLLESLDLDVTIAVDGRDALGAAVASAFDLVFMDLQMPGLDGFATTRALRAEAGYTGPVVAMTAHATQYHRDKCRHSGMNGFVTKPLERGRLADFLASLPSREEDTPEWLWLEPADNRPLT